MKEAIRFARLDFLSIKPYLKNMMFFLVFLLIGMLFNQILLIVFGLFMLVFMLNTYPFAIDEKLSSLYLSLPQRRADIVLGRYLFLLFINLLAVLISLAVGFTEILRRNSMLETAYAMLSLTGINIIVFSFQAPIFFKKGYAKGKIFGLIPIIIVATIIPLFVSLKKNPAIKTIIDNIAATFTNLSGPLTAICIILAIALILVISYYISLNVYSKRDF